jgi:hypothetical protein
VRFTEVGVLESDDLFHIQSFDLLGQGVNFLWSKFAAELWHVAFAVGDDVVQVIGSRGMDFFVRDERWPVHKAALGIIAVTSHAVFLEDGIRG